MTIRTGAIALAVLAGSVTGVSGQSPQPSSGVPDRAAVIQAAADIMKASRYCALVTLGEDGQPQARTVDAFEPDNDMTVWIGTNPVTRKVQQIRKDPRVTLYYFDPAGPGYVTLLGRAEIVDDAAAKAAHWKEDWTRYYRDKNRGSDYVLIKVAPRTLELVSYAHRLLNDPETWRPISIEFGAPASRQERPPVTPRTATGTFDVKLVPQPVHGGGEGAPPGRMTLDKQYHGDLDGVGAGEMLSAGDPSKGSGAYVAVERVRGTLHGRKGTFALYHTGTMSRGAQQLTIAVVPDSGTGDLVGLTGTMSITIDAGKHSYQFAYTLQK